MATNSRKFDCTAEDVFHVLGNGWLYPSWVVGASRMRDVDHLWPRPDSRLHHSFGVWPALINDSTTSTHWDPPHRMDLIARGWPIGEAHVTIEVRPSLYGCIVQITEHPVRGLAAHIPGQISDLALRWRNRETLHRLAYLAEGISDQVGRATNTNE